MLSTRVFYYLKRKTVWNFNTNEREKIIQPSSHQMNEMRYFGPQTFKIMKTIGLDHQLAASYFSWN